MPAIVALVAGNVTVKERPRAYGLIAGGLTMFFFQFLLQGGYFFIVPLFLSVVLELNALQTGARLVPLSLALIVAVVGIPKVWPKASPRRIV